MKCTFSWSSSLDFPSVRYFQDNVHDFRCWTFISIMYKQLSGIKIITFIHFEPTATCKILLSSLFSPFAFEAFFLSLCNNGTIGSVWWLVDIRKSLRIVQSKWRRLSNNKWFINLAVYLSVYCVFFPRVRVHDEACANICYRLLSNTFIRN